MGCSEMVRDDFSGNNFGIHVLPDKNPIANCHPFPCAKTTEDEARLRIFVGNFVIPEEEEK